MYVHMCLPTNIFIDIKSFKSHIVSTINHCQSCMHPCSESEVRVGATDGPDVEGWWFLYDRNCL